MIEWFQKTNFSKFKDLFAFLKTGPTFPPFSWSSYDSYKKANFKRFEKKVLITGKEEENKGKNHLIVYLEVNEWDDWKKDWA